MIEETPSGVYRRKLTREISARRQAETLIEKKSLELYREAQERALAERALRDSEERYRQLVELSPDGILIASERKIVFANLAATQLFRASPAAELLGKDLLSLISPADRNEIEKNLERLESGGISLSAEEQAVRLDGSLVDVSATRIPFRYQGKPAIQIVLRDISERKKLETQLQFQATHDALTGLPNRTLLKDRLQQLIVHSKYHNGRFVVAFVDLDRFKWINDSLGHECGDELLKVVSQRIIACVRESDTIARFGGDEFVLLLEVAGHHDEIKSLLSRVAACIYQPVLLKGHEVTVSCSVGCCFYPEDGQSADALLKFADTAMYQAKESGRNNLQVYNAELREQIDERLKFETELRYAIARHEFVLHYQPQVDLRTGVIVGLEALLRWQHPELGRVSPARFIPVAEETGLIVSIGEWVFQQVCLQAKTWQQQGLLPVRISVNLSARQLDHPGLENMVAQCLATARLDPAFLDLELTESASMKNPAKIIPLMYRLKDLGVSLSIDDFGSGYSNLSYLKQFPVDKLKLDGSFVSEITTDAGSLAIVETVISMAHRLGLKMAAEMAETEDQIISLARLGCDQVQGYYFSKPLPANLCEERLRAKHFALPATTLDAKD